MSGTAPAYHQRAPFPYFGGKRAIARDVWQRLGEPAHYIEPFCGSAAMLLRAPRPAGYLCRIGAGCICGEELRWPYAGALRPRAKGQRDHHTETRGGDDE